MSNPREQIPMFITAHYSEIEPKVSAAMSRGYRVVSMVAMTEPAWHLTVFLVKDKVGKPIDLGYA